MAQNDLRTGVEGIVVGFIYLCTVIDWFSRAALARELSNTLDAGFCVQAPVALVRVLHKILYPSPSPLFWRIRPLGCSQAVIGRAAHQYK